MDFESNGNGEYTAGAADCDIEFAFHYDDAATVLTTFAPGAIVAVEIDLVKGTSTAKFTANMYVDEAPVEAEVRGMVEVVVRGCSSGGYTYPA